MNATTTFGNFAAILDVATPLGEYAGDYAIDALAAAWLDTVNAALPEGYTLAANGDLFGPAADRFAEDRVDVAAIAEDLDFWAVAADHDRAAN